MQELRSTDVLDKEIQSEARKKADKILKKAQDDSRKIVETVDQDIEAYRKEKDSQNQQKLNLLENNLKAAVPLEKARFEVSFVQNALSQAVNEWLSSLSVQKRLELIFKDYHHQKGTKINAYIYGFEYEPAKKYIQNLLGADLLSAEETVFGKIVVEDDLGLEKPEGVILEADDHSLRCCLTMSRLIGHIFDKNRKELSDALFGVKGGEL